MRKVATAAVATAVAALSVVGVANAVDITQTFTGSVTGSHGTKSKPKSVTFKTNITSTANNPAENGTYAVQKTVLYFDKNLTFNPSKFPTCTEDKVNTAEASCKSAKVGTGQANALAGAGGAVKSTNTVNYYNGPKKTLIIKLISPPGAVPDATGTIVAKLSSATGKFGNKLTVPIPAKYQSQLGLTITLTLFTAKIKKTAKGVGYVESKGCSTGGKYNFKGVFTYTNNTPSKTITSTAKCS